MGSFFGKLHAQVGSCLEQGMGATCAGIAGLQAAVDAPDRVRGVQLLDVSLRMLHTSKQAPWQRPLVSSFQRLLRTTQLGAWFFKAIAKPQVLTTCYATAHVPCNAGDAQQTWPVRRTSRASFKSAMPTARR